MKHTVKHWEFWMGLGFLTLCIACEPDSLPEDLPKSGDSVIVKKLTREELQQRFSVMEKLEEIHVGFRISKAKTNDGFTVETEEIIYIEKGNRHSYTFLITMNKEASESETLVLDYKDGTYRTYRIMYDTTSGFVVKKVRYRKSDSEIVWEELADYRCHSKEWQDDLGLNQEDYRALLSELEKKRQSNIDPSSETMRKMSFSKHVLDDFLHSTDLISVGVSGGAESPGDFYDRNGNYLGTDGKDDGKIYLLNTGYKANKEIPDVNWSSTLQGKYITELKEKSLELGGLIIQNRIEEGGDYTISKFITVGGAKNVKGFMLEPAGPSTAKSGQDRRIPEGVYDIGNYSSVKYPDNFILSNDQVPKDRKILYHIGNNGANTEGCNIPGTNKGNGIVIGSRDKMEELREFIKSEGAENVKTIINNEIPK